MAIKVIIELQARKGKYEEMLKALADVHANRKNAPGFLGVTRYEVVDDPDKLVEIAEWENREVRQAWLEKSMESGVLSRLVGTLKGQFKSTTIKEISL